MQIVSGEFEAQLVSVKHDGETVVCCLDELCNGSQARVRPGVCAPGSFSVESVVVIAKGEGAIN